MSNVKSNNERNVTRLLLDVKDNRYVVSTYLNNQNVIKLTNNVNINLSKFFFNDFCFSCDKKIDKIEFHKNHIAFERHQINFIHENFMNFFCTKLQ